MKLSILIGIIICSFLFFGCIENSLPKENDSLENTSFNNNTLEKYDEKNSILNISLFLETDKELYRSAETMYTTIKVVSNKDFEKINLSINGISNRYKEIKEISLIQGENIINSSFKLPKCNVCGGIKEGTYQITGTIVLNNVTFSNLTSIEIRQ
ncbi:MAG: hypothetical protein WC356_04485 [Candidatus Micrarchaeia archaeon]|jgi:hypothetical protein